jgi:hypothetical protein
MKVGRYYLILGAILSAASAQKIYSDGDYVSASLESLQLIQNLTTTLAGISRANMINTSDTILSQIKTVGSHLDIAGATGFAYAFQDKIEALYD